MKPEFNCIDDFSPVLNEAQQKIFDLKIDLILRELHKSFQKNLKQPSPFRYHKPPRNRKERALQKIRLRNGMRAIARNFMKHPGVLSATLNKEDSNCLDIMMYDTLKHVKIEGLIFPQPIIPQQSIIIPAI